MNGFVSAVRQRAMKKRTADWSKRRKCIMDGKEKPPPMSAGYGENINEQPRIQLDSQLYLGNRRRLPARRLCPRQIPMTVIRRLDAMLEGTKEAVLTMKKQLEAAKIDNQWPALCNTAG